MRRVTSDRHAAPVISSRLRQARLAVLAAFFLQGLTLAAIVTRLPAFRDKLGITEANVTALLVMVALIAGVGSVLAELLAARRGSATTLRLALLTIAAAAALIGLAPNRPALFAAFVVYGVGIGAVDAAMNMQGVTVQGLYGRSVMTTFHGMWSIAGVVGALYASGAARLEIGVAPYLAVVAVVGAVITWVAATWFVGSDLVTTEPTLTEVVGAPVPWKPIVMIGIAIVAFFVADTGVLSWSTLYVDDALRSSAAIAPLAYAAYQGGAVLARFGGDLLVRRIGPVAVVRAGTALGLAALVVIVASDNAWVAIVAFAFLGLGLSVIVPLAFAAAGSIGGPNADAAIARVNIFNYLGNIVGGLLIGIVATAGDLRWIFVVPLVLVPVVFLVAARFGAPVTATVSERGPAAGRPPRR